MSSSSVPEIAKRATEFIQGQRNFKQLDSTHLEALKLFLKREYDIIPEKERIGKGMVYITKILAKLIYDHLKSNVFKIVGKKKVDISFSKSILDYIEKIERSEELIVLAIHLLSNLALDSFETTIEKIRQWGTHPTWEIRENACSPLLAGLQSDKKRTLQLMQEWAQDPEENIRRLIAESLRPKTEIKWLRDPENNDAVLDILTILNHDPSIYVRKSVGNNLKDLTKYMPVTILDLIERWLSSKDQLEAKAQKNLVWTIYHALRWLKEKKPEYHQRIRNLVGENYLLYFDEKKNRTATPR